MIPVKTPVELSGSRSDCFIIGDRVRVSSSITRRVGYVLSVWASGYLVVHFPSRYKRKNSLVGFRVFLPSECRKVK